MHMKIHLQLRVSIIAYLLLAFQNLYSQTAENLALHQPAFASSARDGLPDNAFDGSPSTRWMSDYSDPQWIYVDLGGSYSIKQIRLIWDTAFAVNYDLQVSDDAENWITVQSVTGNASLTNDFTNLNANGRYVRVFATVRGNTNGPELYGYFLAEMEVYSHDDPPVVAITSPENNTHHLFTTIPSITATADATGMAGKGITKVELYSGNTLIAVDTDAPYSFSLAGLSQGIHTLLAKAIDEVNAVAFSNPVTVSLSAVTANPCSSPAWNNSTIYSNAGTQVIYLGRLYKNRWYTVGQDPLNNSGAYKVWELVSTCATPTTVNITQPNQNDTFYALASIDIHVDALATAPYRIKKVDLYSGSTLIDSDTSASFNFKWNDVQAGTYTLRAEAIDNADVTTNSVTKTVYVIAGTGCNAPAWRSNIVYSTIGEQVTYQGAVYKNNWYTQGQNPANNSGPYQVWTRIATCPATATITTPGDSAIYTAPASITINATASNPSGGVTKLEFYQGASLLAVDSSAPYSYNWTGVAAGTYILSVKAYGSTGVVATSSSVRVIVQTLQGIYSWTGAGGTSDWNNPANWSPNGIPGSNDSVTIASATWSPGLNNNTTVTDLTMLSGTLQLNGQQLMVTGTARFTGGQVTNGTLNVQCSDAYLSGTVFGSTVGVNITCSNIYLNGSVFNGTTALTKQGNEAVDNDCTGGNIFNGPVTIANNTPFRMRTGNVSGDDYNAAAIFNNNNTGFLDINYNGTSTFAGNITLNSNTAVSFGGGNGIIKLDSNNAQSITKTGLADIIFNRMEVNKTASNVTLNDPLRINTTLTFVNGKIISASDDRLIFHSGATVSGANNASFVSGPVTRRGAGSFTFPVGKDNIYRPISIAPTGSTAEAFTAEYFRGIGPDTSARDLSIHHISGCEYWVLDRTTGSAATPVTLSWDNSSCGVNFLPDLRVARWNGTMWVNEGNGGTTGNANAGTIVTAAPVLSFSPFALASSSPNNVLPVQLLYFTVTKKETRTLLEWSTAAEYQNRGFDVERSSDGVQFEDIGFVDGAGNSNYVHTYSMYDNAPLPGRSYYRLRQTDTDGRVTYSKIVSVEFILPGNLVQLLPNPTTGYINLVFRLTSPENCTLTITDLTGRLLYTNQLRAVTFRAVHLDLSRYANGLYLLIINTPGGILYREKIMKK